MGRGGKPNRRLAADKLAFAERLRNRPTASERRLWDKLQDGKLCNLEFYRQVLISGYIVDFVCPVARLVVEADGQYHSATVDADEAREQVIRNEGFGVLRLTNDEIDRNVQEAVQRIRYWALRGALNEYIRAIDAGEPPQWHPVLGDVMAAMFDDSPESRVLFTFEGPRHAAESRRGEWNVELSLWDLNARGAGERPVIALIRADNAWLKTFSNPANFMTLREDQRIHLWTRVIFRSDEIDFPVSPWGLSPWWQMEDWMRSDYSL